MVHRPLRPTARGAGGDPGAAPSYDQAAGAGARQADGNIYQVGSTTAPPAVDSDAAIVKWTAGGEVAAGWPERYDGTGDGNDHFYDVAVDRSGKVHAVGDAYSASERRPTPTCAATTRSAPRCGVPPTSTLAPRPCGSVACDRAGNTYAGGYSNEAGANPAYLVMKKVNDGVSTRGRRR